MQTNICPHSFPLEKFNYHHLHEVQKETPSQFRMPEAKNRGLNIHKR